MSNWLEAVAVRPTQKGPDGVTDLGVVALYEAERDRLVRIARGVRELARNVACEMPVVMTWGDVPLISKDKVVAELRKLDGITTSYNDREGA